MIYCFDIDGTLCTNTHGEYETAQPIPEMVAEINALHEEGHRILLFTARGTTTGIDWRELTAAQLDAWGVRYDELILGKPQADVYVDDRGVSTDEWKSRRVSGDGASGSALGRGAYLDLTYSEERAPRGDYPALLARLLLDRVYRAPGRLLDLGCGRGDALDAFADLGFETWGVDVSPRVRDLAPRHRVEVADVERESLPVSAGTFDAVFSKSVVEHMHRPMALLDAAFAALRPGGVAVVMTPSWEHNAWGPFYVDHTHVTPFTVPSLADALELAGFGEVEVSHFHQLPFLWRRPYLRPAVRALASLPLRYRPYDRGARWPEAANKAIRFAKEVMLIGVARKPA